MAWFTPKTQNTPPKTNGGSNTPAPASGYGYGNPTPEVLKQQRNNYLMRKIGPYIALAFLGAMLAAGLGMVFLQLVDEFWLRIPKILQVAAALAGGMCMLAIGLHAIFLSFGTGAIVSCIKAIAEAWLNGQNIRDMKTLWQLLVAFFAVGIMVPIVVSWSLGKVTSARVPTNMIQDLIPEGHKAAMSKAATPTTPTDVPPPQLFNITAGTVVMHKVKKGETINSIANRYQTSPNAIRQANGITGDKISINQTLKIPS